MKSSLIIKYIIPFLQWYTLMIILALGADYLLHQWNMAYVGRYLGLAGTTIILFSFLYSLRKRKLIQISSPKLLLTQHEYLAWLGSILLLIHAGIHFNALLPWLAIQMLLIVVASGLIGKFILKKATEQLRDKQRDLTGNGLTMAEAEKRIFMDSITVSVMKKWRDVHIPLTLILAILAVLHVITIIMFGK